MNELQERKKERERLVMLRNTLMFEMQTLTFKDFIFSKSSIMYKVQHTEKSELEFSSVHRVLRMCCPTRCHRQLNLNYLKLNKIKNSISHQTSYILSVQQNDGLSRQTQCRYRVFPSSHKALLDSAGLESVSHHRSTDITTCYHLMKHMEISLSSTLFALSSRDLKQEEKKQPTRTTKKREQTKRTVVKIRSFEESEADVMLGASMYYIPPVPT